MPASLALDTALPARRLRPLRSARRLVRSARTRLAAAVTLDLDVGDLGLDDGVLHADLAELFERRDG